MKSKLLNQVYKPIPKLDRNFLLNSDSNPGRHRWNDDSSTFPRPSPACPSPWTRITLPVHQMLALSETPWSNGRDSIKRSSLLLLPPWRVFFKSSVQLNRHDRLINRIDSSKTDSSHGITNGPWFAKPNSSSALTKRFLRTGWLRCVARTTNLLRLLPT